MSDAVALRKESVDRKVLRSAYYSPSPVALRKESVDRKGRGNTMNIDVTVALRKESVDRKMLYDTTALMKCQVALRKESVDRKTDPINLSDIPASRSPQGERG